MEQMDNVWLHDEMNEFTLWYIIIILCFIILCRCSSSESVVMVGNSEMGMEMNTAQPLDASMSLLRTQIRIPEACARVH